MTARIVSATLEELRITPKTVWSFVRIATDDGHVGTGEATLIGADPPLKVAAAWLAGLVGRPPTRDTLDACAASETLSDAALLSAVDTTIYDLAGQVEGVPVATLLGGLRREQIPLYANINRATVDRSPEGFAATAERAKSRGFSTFKLAPFDEVTTTACEADDFAAGLARIAAARTAVGEEARLRIDCHWRFTEAAALAMIDAAAAYEPDWIECPVAEVPENAATIARLRRHANRHGIRLAGLEMGVGVEAFVPYLEAEAYDVIMPDVKYLGGLALMNELYSVAARHGAAVSPHNPSGPICHAASLHVCAALPDVDSLEMQFDESPLFDTLLDGSAFSAEGGIGAVPTGPGLGAALDMDVAEPLRV